MKALVILAIGIGLASPAQAFFHSAAHGGGHPGGPSFGHGQGPGHAVQGHGSRGYGLLDGILASGFYPPGDYNLGAEPALAPQPFPVPVPIPVPVAAPRLTQPADSGPRIIYIGHQPPRRDLPRVIYGTARED